MNPHWITHSPRETREAGAEIARRLAEGGILLLSGDLGAGKTCLVQGVAEGLGISGPLTSPTYGLVKEYEGTPPLIHADLYRLTDPEDCRDLGLEEWMEVPAVVAVEWWERAPAFWPENAWRVRMEGPPDQPGMREIHLTPGRAT